MWRSVIPHARILISLLSAIRSHQADKAEWVGETGPYGYYEIARACVKFR